MPSRQRRLDFGERRADADGRALTFLRQKRRAR